MTRYAMVIDLHKCVGCGGCDMACKSENNVPAEFHWANHIIETHGEFPNVRYKHVPTLCNHCDNAPCVRVCPTTAMHKQDNGITMHDHKKCIGCKSCYLACPYGVISFNHHAPDHFVGRDGNLTKGTSSPKDLRDKSGKPFPYYNRAREATHEGVRSKGVVEKCTFCDHRLKNNELPYCVDSCPADARIFGDLDDPLSRVSTLLREHKPEVLKEDEGTKPQVYYIREYFHV